jgi:NAD-dependent SIR2 family protein deacetylase
VLNLKIASTRKQTGKVTRLHSGRWAGFLAIARFPEVVVAVAVATVSNTETERELDRAADLLRGRRIITLTGAGVSTDSGIPDYRGDGSPKRRPMNFQQFLGDDDFRKRYWAGSHLGWQRFRDAEPNRGHAALADMELAGIVSGVITQNVDGLHTRAGSRKVVDLHGSMDRVVCLDCGQVFARSSISARIDEANPWLDKPDAVEIAPDGDAIVSDIEDFVIPTCTVCGGRLKPDVVFFGEFIPVEKFREATALVHGSDALLIAGSSLVVNSGIRLLEQARRRKITIVIVNRGDTKGDSRATVKLDAGTSETLIGLSARLMA